MDDVVRFYSNSDEQSRLTEGVSLERLRSQTIIEGLLPERSLDILDVGGAAGVYSFWLASRGHRVSLVDLTPKHVELARAQNAESAARLVSITVGDATDLAFDDASFDLVLMMGPLYHLQDRGMRIRAIVEALRVLRPGGTLVIACISRFASLVDGFQYGFVDDPLFRPILEADLRTGNHINDTGNPVYFTSAHLHLPEEVTLEVREAGGIVRRLVAVEGVGSIVPQLDAKIQNPGFRDYLLAQIAATEDEPSFLGVSSHFMLIVAKHELPRRVL